MVVRCFLFFLLFCISLSANEPVHPDFTITIPMRDGTQLPADVYLPYPSSENLPCVLMRSPAGRKASSALYYTYFAKMGYAVVIQDTRSAVDKEGKTIPYYADGWGEHQDGYDTVQWLAQNPLTNGKIGTLGASALGITQLLMAPTAPNGLVCQYVRFAAASLYQNAIFPGGQILKNQVEGWLGFYAKHPSVLEFLCKNREYNDFWAEFDSTKKADQVKVPGIHVGGWYDTFIQGTLESFAARQEKGSDGARGKQKLVVGPWTHFYPSVVKLGDFEVPDIGRKPPYDISPERWFEHYLKGAPNGVELIPNVIYFVMGPFDGSASSGNVWRSADKWPVPSSDSVFYLTGDQTLSEKKSEEKTLGYTYNPADPVPTIGGRNLFLDSGPKDQRPVESRQDVLVFTSEVLDEDWEVTGNISATIFHGCDFENSNVSVRLTDVYPDGKSLIIADGLTHMGNPCIDRLPQKLDECKIEKSNVDLWSTSVVFAKGHKIRVTVTASNYPRFEKITHADTAKNVIGVGGNQASYITLPVVRKGNKWTTDYQGKP